MSFVKLSAEDKRIFLPAVLVLFLLYFNLTSWQQGWLGWILFLLYLLAAGKWWQEIFSRVFSLRKKNWLTKIFSWLAVFLLLSFAGSIAVVFHKLTPLIVWFCFVIVGVISWLIGWLSRKARGTRNKESGTENGCEILFNKNIIYHLSFIIYFILWLIAFYLLFRSSSAAVLQSPWQTIHKYYLPIFFILTFLSGLFLFVKFRIKTILFILVLQSLLLHLYLPLSHQNLWGGDVWRHIAIEKRIEAGERVLPVLLGEQAEWREFAGIGLPAVFFSPQKFAYGQLWGASVLLSQTLRVDLITINKWLMPIVWSLAMPFILFRLGWLLFDSRRKGLWLAWLSFLVFPLQALGALTLPVSLGYLTFFFVLIFWLQYLRDNIKAQRNLVLFFSILMLFGYSLHFILIWAVIIFSYLLMKVTSYKLQVTSKSVLIVSKVLMMMLMLLSIFIFPAIELLAKISYLPASIHWWSNIKQAIGQFSGWFYAGEIRPHDILSGNIIFNHTPDYAFVSAIFTDWRWWLIPAMIVIWLLVGLGIYRVIKLQVTSYKLQILLFSTVFGGYLLGWFVLEGDRLLTRRLDAVLAILILILILHGLSFIIYHLSNDRYQITNSKLIKSAVILLVLGLSWFTTSTYASGPDMRVVSVDEYEAAKYISETTKTLPSPPLVGEGRVGSCVLADTWVLLPLEALSKGQIIGGGFPIDYNFGQLERVELFSQFQQNPNEESLNKAKELTGAEECWFVAGIMNKELGIRVSEVFGSEAVEMGELGVWELKKNE